MQFLFRTILLFLLLFQLPAAAQKAPGQLLKWTSLPSLPSTDGQLQHGLAGMAGGVHNGVMLMSGGANFPGLSPWKGGTKKYYDNIFVLEKRNDGSYSWREEIYKLPRPFAYAASVTVPQGVLLIGGEDRSGPLNHVLLLQWDQSAGKVNIKTLPSLPEAMTNLSATTIGSTVYVAGGETVSGTSANGYFIDVSSGDNSWKPMPVLPLPVSHAALVAQANGEATALYLVGGRMKTKEGTSVFFNEVFELRPGKKEWEPRTPLSDGKTVRSISATTAVPIGATNILLFGGDEGHVFSQLEQLNIGIQSTSGVEKDSLIANRDSILAHHPGFSRDVFLYNTITRAWTKISEMPYAPVTTRAVLWGTDILIPSGEVAPGMRTPQVLAAEVTRPVFFSWLDTMVLIACFLLMTFARYFFVKKQAGTEDYFKGGRRIPRWAAGISIYGAKLSAITFMGIPAKTFSSNWTYFFMLMTIIMIMPVIAKYFIPFYRRLNVTSAYEYLERRFNYSSRAFVSVLYILFQLGRMSIVILLPSIALTLVTGINLYTCIFLISAISIFFTVKGGIEAVIWVEVVQVLILALGALFCLFYLPFQISNWDAAWNAIQNGDKLKLFDFRFDFTTPTFWVVIIGGLSMHLFTYGADQTTVQRYLTTTNQKESIRSLKLGAWLTVPSTIVFFSIGTLMFLFFREHPGQINPGLNSTDNIFPWFIVSQLPAGISGLLIAGIFAAAMSSTEASMNSVATLLTTDFYQILKPGSTDRQRLFFARGATLFIGLFAAGIAFYMAYSGVSSLWDQFNSILGLFTGSIGGIFLLGIFTRVGNGRGAVCGMVASCLVQLAISWTTDLHLLMYAFTGLASCFGFGLLFSYLFKSDQQSLQGLTIYDRQKKSEENQVYAG